METTGVASPSKKVMTKRVPFVARGIKAREVVLVGEFTSWSKDGIRLTGGETGDWAAVLHLPPGEYQYRLIVDGEWRDHPDAARRVANPYGSQNCILTVS